MTCTPQPNVPSPGRQPLVYSSHSRLKPGLHRVLTQGGYCSFDIRSLQDTGFPPRFRGEGAAEAYKKVLCNCLMAGRGAGLDCHETGRAGQMPSIGKGN
jgi:hypothetical protein